MSAHASCSIKWDLQERCSGSGRLSSQSREAGLCVGFPVDFRYGWDLGEPSHMAMLRRADDHFKPLITFNAPDCRLWGGYSEKNYKDKFDELERKRDAERPYLQSMFEHNQQVAADGRIYIMENLFGSAI